MKVKFLRSGIEAHSDCQLGNFKFTEGENMSGLSEETAMQMKSDGNAEIIGEDDIAEEDDAAEEAEDAAEEVENAEATEAAEEKVKAESIKPWSK
jgi:hypothetical protein